GRRIFDRPHERLEHEVEEARLGQRAFGPANGTLGIRSSWCSLNSRIVGAKSLLAVAAVDEGIGEASDVPTGHPDFAIHENRRVESLDVVARADHRVPPAVLEIPLQLDAEGAIVPHRPSTAVDLG